MLKSIMMSLTFQGLLTEISCLKQLKNLKNLNYKNWRVEFTKNGDIFKNELFKAYGLI